MPLPGTRIVHPQFQARWRPIIAATFRSLVRVTRPGNPQGTRDWEAGRTTVATPFVVYSGPARVQSRTTGATRGAATQVADRPVTVGAYLIAVPTDSAPALLRDVVEILECNDDPALQGLVLYVVDVPHADVAWQRNLGCDLHQPTIKR